MKADAYGLGDGQICKFVEDEVDCFAVSCASEFFKVKKVIKKDVIILDSIYENITKLAQKNAIFCISNYENFKLIKNCAMKNKNLLIRVNIAINSGMNRFGFSKENELVEIIQEISKIKNILIVGVFSHYFAAENRCFSLCQKEKFKYYKNLILKNHNKNKILFHICATSALCHFEKFDMVRIGIGAYNDKIYDTIKLSAKILDFQNLKTGESAGYNRQFIALNDTKIAIVSIGYADGLFRKIVQKGYVLINNNFCKIIAICMDSIMVDVTNISCKINDDVTIIGKNGDKQIFVCDLAGWCDTIDYEILTHITKRVKRRYLKG